MVSPAAYGAFVILSLAVLGASAGLVVFVQTEGTFAAGHLVAVFFVATFVASAMGAQMYRRDLAGSVLVGAAAGASGVLAFFAAPFYWLTRVGFEPPAPGVLGVFLIVAPLVEAALAGGGALFLREGVRRYRARHGLVHAPRAR